MSTRWSQGRARRGRMRLTIIPSDNTAYIDGVALTVDCSSIADREAPGAAVQAVQWNGSTGWIEYAGDEFGGSRPPNRPISDVSQFHAVIDAWANVRAVASAAATAAAAATPVVKP